MYWSQGCLHVAGVDEAGRGCLAGPVVAASVVMPPDLDLPDVRDSKQLTPERREAIALVIRRSAVAIGVGVCSPEEIDRLNILWASMEAMRRATADLAVTPDIVLIDGNHTFPHSTWPTRPIVKGDTLSQCIAAASIIAKTVRDRMMRELDTLHPGYGWRHNAGYPTAEHYDALERQGPTPHHRQSFKLVRTL